jgi:hypothetical protein
MTSLVLVWHIHLLLQLVHLIALGRLWKPDIVGRVVCGKEGGRLHRQKASGLSPVARVRRPPRPRQAGD